MKQNFWRFHQEKATKHVTLVTSLAFAISNSLILVVSMLDWKWSLTSIQGRKGVKILRATYSVGQMDYFSDPQWIVVLDPKVYDKRLGKCSTVVIRVRRIDFLISLYKS